ncbi:unnamed protein product [Zymoseptoria tritici ST99CH_1A5]|uniref:Uncharacterized protein n=3 Tax=Zymoseptoria tritici TaxID=1047171 RepID=A0A1X7S0V4_ZYMT9|nr:unnamed protein product [Zymoseptoria tritici ST99CH_3D7]SMR56898.1 unnamed protein product [Zymoseptoria tritici ST99CH_1E4]SMY26947.1 unnamed protein product [Zymoseptoria tritici ST99CH_1A5]
MSSDIMADFKSIPTLASNNPYAAQQKRRANSVPLATIPAASAPNATTDGSSTPPKRQDSMFNTDTTSRSQSPVTAPPQPTLVTRHYSIGTVPVAYTSTMPTGGLMRSRTYGMGSPVIDRANVPLSDDDIIIVTVKLTNRFRKNSITGAEDLPGRPQKRSFLRRLSTRVAPSLDHSAEKEERYKAVKMPRGEYKKRFIKNADGKYVGTEPEKEWDEEELEREYGQY